jgi:hypothetical protein
MKADVASAEVSGRASELELIAQAEPDLRAAGRIAKLTFRRDDSVADPGQRTADAQILVNCTF